MPVGIAHLVLTLGFVILRATGGYRPVVPGHWRFIERSLPVADEGVQIYGYKYNTKPVALIVCRLFGSVPSFQLALLKSLLEKEGIRPNRFLYSCIWNACWLADHEAIAMSGQVWLANG